MSAMFRWRPLVLAGLWLAAAAGPAWGLGTVAAGRFLSVTGDVQVVGGDGARRKAERGGEFREGDTIVTGSNALAQARTADGGLISVRADTEMKLDKFAYAGEKDSNASFLVSLVKGGFRTITGLIGRANRDGYKINTPSATIGIRGTHYELVHVLPQAASPQAPAGTYNRVYDGITTFQNKTGVLLLVNREQTAFVPLPGNVAPVLVAPPAPVFGKPTPVPRLVPQSSTGAPQSTAGGEIKPQTATGTPVLVRPTTTLTPLTTTISPIESTTTVKSSTTTTLSPTTSTLIAPTTTTTTLSPTTSTLSTTTLTAPTTSTLSTTTLTSPTLSTTTTISPTISTTTTISPTTTTISPTTTTILK